MDLSRKLSAVGVVRARGQVRSRAGNRTQLEESSHSGRGGSAERWLVNCYA